MPSTLQTTVYLSTALLCATIASVTDVRSRRIPNWLTGPAIIAGLVIHLVLEGWSSAVLALAAAAVGGGIFLLFHIAGGMGAGDVKLMTAIACVVGFHSLVPVLAMTAIMGGVFALCLAIARGKLKETIFNISSLMNHHRVAGLTPHPYINLDNRQTLRLPYAIAIAAGCFITFCSAVSPR